MLFYNDVDTNLCPLEPPTPVLRHHHYILRVSQSSRIALLCIEIQVDELPCLCVRGGVLSPFTLGIRTTTAYAELVLQPVSGHVSGLLLGLLPCVGLFVFVSPATAQDFV